jgi:hypothetical protein
MRLHVYQNSDYTVHSTPLLQDPSSTVSLRMMLSRSLKPRDLRPTSPASNGTTSAVHELILLIVIVATK